MDLTDYKKKQQSKNRSLKQKVKALFVLLLTLNGMTYSFTQVQQVFFKYSFLSIFKQLLIL